MFCKGCVANGGIPFRNLFVILLLLIVINTSFLFAQADWENRTGATQPALRKEYAISQGPGGYVYLYGGWQGSTDYYGVYRWTGTEWTNIIPDASSSHPTANYRMKMAYDAVNDTMVCFNGQFYNGSGSEDVNETWTFNGTSWTDRTATANQPTFRKDYALSTGPDGYVYLYGGYSGSTDYFGVYRWTGSAWVNVIADDTTSHPTANGKMFMARDVNNNEMLLARGAYYDSSYIEVYETWSFASNTWTNKNPAISPTFPRDQSQMSTGPDGQVYFYGGYKNDSGTYTYYKDLWKWNGTNWEDITPATSPTISYFYIPGSYYQCMAYDSVNNELVLFGGMYRDTVGDQDVQVNETWVYSLGAPSLNVSCTGGVGSFTIDGPASFNGGSDFTGSSYNSNVPEGSYTITFQAESGYVIEVESTSFPETNPTTYNISGAGSHTVTGHYYSATNNVAVSSTAGGSTDKDGNNPVARHGSITISASPQTGYHFTGWSGDASGTTNPLTISDITSAQNITANFAINQYSVNVSSTAGGSTNRDGANLVNHGSTFTITSTADTGYDFSGWSGGANGTDNPITITVTSNLNITANFAIKSYTVNVSSGTGGSTDKDGANTVNHGSTLTITPSESTGYHFTGWSGDAGGTANPLTVTVTSNMNINASFAINQYTVTVNSGGNGYTDKDGSNTVNHGDSFTITPTGSTGYQFANWSGDASGNENPLTVTVTGNMTITANFQIRQYSVTVNSSAGGYTDHDGTHSINHGEPLTITPSTDPGYHFSCWGGDASGNSNPLTVTVTSDMTINAVFEGNQYTVTVNAVSNGHTDKDGSNTVHHGDSFTITATADPGYGFHHWTGDASGSANPLTINNITGNMDITPAFEATYTVTFSAGAHGQLTGTATQNVFAGADCSAVEVTNVEAGWDFANWTGTGGFVTSSSNPLTVTNVRSDMAITASYTAQTGSLTVTVPNAAEVGGNHVARWRRLGTTTWFNSGATESGVPVPSSPVEVEYRSVSGWNKPANNSGIAITNGGNAVVVSAPYVKAAFEGWLVVDLLPEAAVNKGARWRVDGGAWMVSGSTSEALSVGSHLLEFKGIQGWQAPQQRNVNIVDGQKTFVTATYEEITGHKPVIHYFTADPEVAAEGDPVTLAWDVRDADEVSIDNGIGDVKDHGELKTNLQQTTTFTLTSSNSFGQSKAVITAEKIKEAEINWFTSSNPEAKPCSLGSKAILSWSITGAESAGIDTDGDGEIDITVNPESGELEVLPESGGSRYELVVNNLLGSKSAFTAVAVSSLPEIRSFNVDHPTVVAGNKVRFTWEVKGADTISIMPAPGAVTGNSVEFEPETDGEYTLTAENQNGSVSSIIDLEMIKAKRASDLQVSLPKGAITAEAKAPVAGMPVSVKAVISNTGNKAARKFDLSLTRKADGVLLASKRITRLAAGASQTVILSFVPDGYGKVKLQLEVDAGHNVAELSEANNAAAAAVVVNKAEGVDLLVSDVNVEKAAVGAPDGALDVSFCISNAGQTNADSFQYRIFLSNRNRPATTVKSFLLGEEHIERLNSNKRVRVNLRALLPASLSKKFYVIIMADVHGAVVEENKDNNIFIRKYKVKDLK